MGVSSALAGRLNRSCVLYKSCAISTMVGRVWTSSVGSSRVRSGQVGISRARAGDIFFLVIVVVTLLHRFFRFQSRFLILAASPRHSSTTFADAGLRSVRWRLGGRVSCPDASGRFEPGRSGQVSHKWICNYQAIYSACLDQPFIPAAIQAI